MKWEYKIESITINEKWSVKKQQEQFEQLNQKLNDLGSLGWEMISYESIPMLGAISKQLRGYSYVVFFKKAIKD